MTKMFRSLRGPITLLGGIAMISLGSTLLTGCPSSETSSTPPVDEKAIKAQAETDAAKQIDEKNADTVMKDLEKEINSDTEE
jgi:hypothetical protein